MRQSKGKANLAGRDDERKALGITLAEVATEAGKVAPFAPCSVSHVCNVFAARRNSRRVVTAYKKLVARRTRRLAVAG